VTRVWRLLLGAELRTVARDTPGLVIPIALPLLILVGNALNVPADALSRFVLPLVLTVVIGSIGLVNAPATLATYRKTGVLQRLAVTPVRPAAVLGAHMVAGSLQILGGVLLACLLAVGAFGAGAPRSLLATAGALILATAAMFALGLLIAAVAPSINAALAIGLVVFFGLGAVGGMFGPVTNLPGGLARVGEALPFGASVQAINGAWNDAGPGTAPVLALVLCTILCGAVATRAFRWT
jgi:ABC-2 type transport system permease protein